MNSNNEHKLVQLKPGKLGLDIKRDGTVIKVKNGAQQTLFDAGIAQYYKIIKIDSDDFSPALLSEKAKGLKNYEIEFSISNNKTTRKQSTISCGNADTDSILVRTKKYLQTNIQSDKKAYSRTGLPVIMNCIGAEILDHRSTEFIHQNPNSKVYSTIRKDTSDNFYFIMNMKFPNGKSIVCYWCFNPNLNTIPDSWRRLWIKFLNANVEDQKKMLKMYPNLVECPYLVQLTLLPLIPNRPSKVLQKVESYICQEPNFMEIGIRTDGDRTSSMCIKLGLPVSENCTLDICWLLEVQNEEELPECVFAATRISGIKF